MYLSWTLKFVWYLDYPSFVWQDITIKKLRDIPKNDIQKAQTTHLCIKQHKRKSNDLFYFLHIFLCSMTWGQIDGCSNSIQIRSHSRQFSRLRKKIIQNCEDKRQISRYSKSFCKSKIAQKKTSPEIGPSRCARNTL